MITKNTDYSIQRLRGLSTDTKPTDVPNGSEFREMDTGKDFMYDADNESWEEQPKKGGGGGGGGGGYTADEIAAGISGTLVLNATEISRDSAFRSQRFTRVEAANLVSGSSNTGVQYVFGLCVNLISVYFPKLSEIKGAAFLRGCTALKSVAFPKLSGTIGGALLLGCTALEAVDFSAADRINSDQLFEGCSNLKTMVLRKNSVVSVNAPTYWGFSFKGTPFASNGTGGTLYVPQALIAEYQSATNWSVILSYANNQILPIEGSIYETQYADGTPISIGEEV